MVVCTYFLKGECRFGDRCKYEHPGPSQNVFGSQQSFGNQSVFGENRSTSGFGGGNKNTFNRNQNRFGALSNEVSMGGAQNTAFGGGNQQQSSTESMLQNPTQVTQIQQIVRRDMETWEASKQWPLSCYTYLKDEPCLTGLMDFSPEEIRKEAYDAKADNKALAYEQGLKTLLEKSKQRRMELKNINLHQLQTEIRSSVAIKSSSESSMRVLPTGQQPGTGSPFGGSAPLSQSPALFGSGSAPSLSGGLFGAAPGIQQPFGTIPTASVDMGTASPQTSSTGAASSLFGSTSQGLFGTSSASSTPSNTLFGTGNTSTSVFGTATAVSQSGPMLQTTFGNPPVPVSSTAPGAAPSTCPLTCSEEDIAAFKADKFVLGKIPECPPPPELCS